MGSTVTHHCDRCLKDVPKRELQLFVAELDYDPEKGSAGARQPLRGGEVCKACAEAMVGAVTEAWLAGR